MHDLHKDIEENGVKLRLTVVDTPGYGDFVNNDESWQPILANIEARFDAYLEQENRVNRAKLVDNRIHALLYFVEPTGHALKQVDIEFMRRLHTKVNLIPVIAKADTMTDDELAAFKKRVSDSLVLCLATLKRFALDFGRHRPPPNPDIQGAHASGRR